MDKTKTLRAALTAALPDIFARDPERLQMWVDKGKVRRTNTASPSFEWTYTLSVYLTEFSGHPGIPAVIINHWLATNQPDLLQPSGGYTFEAEIIDENTWDLLFELQLTEDAMVTAMPGGGWTIEHPGEPDPMFPDDAALTDPETVLQQGWAGATQVV